MTHKGSHDQTEKLSSSESEKHFFLVVGITVVTVAIGLMVYYLFNTANTTTISMRQDSKKTSQHQSTAQTDTETKKIDPALHEMSFNDNEKVRLVVGYTTPNSAEVLEELQNDEYIITRFYWNEPVFGVEVNESGYEKLVSSSKVDTIELDK